MLVEADLRFKATAGLHHAWPNEARNERGQALPQHGFLNLMMALDALIDGADPAEAAELLAVEDRTGSRRPSRPGTSPLSSGSAAGCAASAAAGSPTRSTTWSTLGLLDAADA